MNVYGGFEHFWVLFGGMKYTLDTLNLTFGVIHNENNSKIAGRTISVSRLPKQDCRQSLGVLTFTIHIIGSCVLWLCAISFKYKWQKFEGVSAFWFT